MADYIFCTKKKNTPRIDVRICQRKCPYREKCQEYLAYQESTEDRSSILNSGLIMSPLFNPVASKN
jgi:hypothetical protein